MTEEELKLIVRGVDQGASKVAKDVAGDVRAIGTDASKSAGLVDRLSGSLKGLGGWVKAGLGIGIGLELQRVLSDVLGSVSSAFFDAVEGGAAWAQTVKDVQRATGMTAQETSTLLAVMERVGVPVDNATRTLAIFGRNLAENEALFVKLGIATRDSNGNFLSAATIIANTRQEFAKYGESLANTGAAQELFGRSGYKVLEFLQLSDAQIKIYTEDAARAGQVIGDDLTNAVERFHRSQNALGGVIQGLQAQIFGALGPTLETFVGNFTTWVQTNMRTIVQFVANVANYIAGVIGGLFGFDFAAKTTEQTVADLGTASTDTGKAIDGLSASTRKAKTGQDSLTAAINAQIKGIDDQIAAISRRSDALHAAEERARLDASLASAQQQLADLKGNAPFTAGLSNAEAVLARQKHAQDIIDAQKAVSDAGGALSMFEADQSVAAERRRLEAKKASLQEELAAHKKAIADQAQGAEWLTGVNLAQDTKISAAATALYAGITANAKSWRDSGVKFAGDLKTAITAVAEALLGSDVTAYEGSTLVTRHHGGLVGALGSLGDVMGATANVVSAAVSMIWSALGPLADFLRQPAPGSGSSGGPTAGSSLWDQFSTLLKYGAAGPFALGDILKLFDGKAHAAGGWVGLNGPEIGLLGEKGPEYIETADEARARRSSSGGFAPAGPIVVNLDGRTLFEIVDERLYVKLANMPVGR